ncbi:FKBP-type peptidyl-prolyl cis-trans isomerase [Aestuariivivens sediminis]|uniref:FKBP-type peptidyl-prolyl cis-trans isomerase n=1 Tax=Aestuariivivens sediminis TaxID=2913557 RepID=UPI001F571A2D|nr:FKBP-type peptidyl-prolyl cis-trans isomerase [Aestuariivivens sediminis]
MKFIKLLSVVILTSTVVSCGKKATTKEDLKTELDSVSYALGMDVGRNVEMSFEDINNDLFIEGYLNTLDSADVLIDKDMAQGIVQDYFQKNREKIMKKQQEIAAKKAEEQYGEVKEASEKFLQDNVANNPDVLTTESGLQYLVLEEGTGNQPTATSKVKVHYHGTLIDGTVFDSSVDRDQPATFGVNQVIPGWTEGLQLMKEGAKYKFFIPQNLAYGAAPRGGKIRPFDALIFEVELLEVMD